MIAGNLGSLLNALLDPIAQNVRASGLRINKNLPVGYASYLLACSWVERDEFSGPCVSIQRQTNLLTRICWQRLTDNLLTSLRRNRCCRRLNDLSGGLNNLPGGLQRLSLCRGAILWLRPRLSKAAKQLCICSRKIHRHTCQETGGRCELNEVTMQHFLVPSFCGAMSLHLKSVWKTCRSWRHEIDLLHNTTADRKFKMVQMRKRTGFGSFSGQI